MEQRLRLSNGLSTPMTERPHQADPPNQAAQDQGQPRKCVACGYNLFGLGEEPRCPECGLTNIPEVFRREVWELVDSGKWFFSSFFNPFAKRPPGWWWALDRKGDVDRSFVFALSCLLVSAILMIVVGTVLGSIGEEVTRHYSMSDPNDPQGQPLDAGTYVKILGFGNTILYSRWAVDDHALKTEGWVKKVTETRRLTYHLSAAPAETTAMLWVTGVLFWAVPALIGICTQIRRGLPSFARAPRTIIAAANYEAHRVVYVNLAIVIAICAEISLRIFSMNGNAHVYVLGGKAVFWMTFIYASLSWTGAVRSDYTRQLIRSRGHAVRFILMYGFLFPLPLAVILIFAYVMIFQRFPV